MNIEAPVIKLVDLSAVKIKDLKTRRIFILANGKNSLKEIFKLASFDEASGTEMARELLEAGYISVEGSSAAAPQPVSGEALAGSRADFTFMDEDIELLVTALGKHIGPIAPLLVKKTVKAGQSVSHKEMADLFDSFADKIEDQGKRQQFLAEVRADFS